MLAAGNGHLDVCELLVSFRADVCAENRLLPSRIPPIRSFLSLFAISFSIYFSTAATAALLGFTPSSASISVSPHSCAALALLN
jgi:hypothetical protein